MWESLIVFIKYNFLWGSNLESFHKIVNIVRVNCLSHYIQLVKELIMRIHEGHVDLHKYNQRELYELLLGIIALVKRYFYCSETSFVQILCD